MRIKIGSGFVNREQTWGVTWGATWWVCITNAQRVDRFAIWKEQFKSGNLSVLYR